MPCGPEHRVVFGHTKTKKYHEQDCVRYLRNGGIEMTVEEAETQGYKPCRVCHVSDPSSVLLVIHDNQALANAFGLPAETPPLTDHPDLTIAPPPTEPLAPEPESSRQDSIMPSLSGAFDSVSEPVNLQPPASPSLEADPVPADSKEPSPKPLIESVSLPLSPTPSLPIPEPAGAVEAPIPMKAKIEAPSDLATLVGLIISMSLAGPANVDNWFKFLAEKYQRLESILKALTPAFQQTRRYRDSIEEQNRTVQKAIDSLFRNKKQELMAALNFIFGMTFPHEVKSSHMTQGKEVKYHLPECENGQSARHSNLRSEEACLKWQQGATCCHPIAQFQSVNYGLRKDIPHLDEVCVGVTPTGVLHMPGCQIGYRDKFEVRRKVEEVLDHGKKIGLCCAGDVPNLLRSYNISVKFPVHDDVPPRPVNFEDDTQLLPASPGARRKEAKSGDTKTTQPAADRAAKEANLEKPQPPQPKPVFTIPSNGSGSEKPIKTKDPWWKNARPRWVILLALIAVFNLVIRLSHPLPEEGPDRSLSYRLVKWWTLKAEPRIVFTYHEYQDNVVAWWQNRNQKEEEESQPPVVAEQKPREKHPRQPTAAVNEPKKVEDAAKKVWEVSDLSLEVTKEEGQESSNLSITISIKREENRTVVDVSIKNDSSRSEQVSIHRDDVDLLMEENDYTQNFRVESFEGSLKWIVGYLEKGTPMYRDRDPDTKNLIWKSGIIRLLKPGTTIDGQIVFQPKIDLSNPFQFKFSDLEGRVWKTRYAPAEKGG